MYGSPALDAAWCELTRSGESPLPAVVQELRSAQVPPRMQVGLDTALPSRLGGFGFWRRQSLKRSVTDGWQCTICSCYCCRLQPRAAAPTAAAWVARQQRQASRRSELVRGRPIKPPVDVDTIGSPRCKLAIFRSRREGSARWPQHAAGGGGGGSTKKAIRQVACTLASIRRLAVCPATAPQSAASGECRPRSPARHFAPQSANPKPASAEHLPGNT